MRITMLKAEEAAEAVFYDYDITTMKPEPFCNMLIKYAERIGVAVVDEPIDDLWPSDIQSSSIKPPVTILKEQGTFLGRKTSNIVEGVVRSKETEGEFSWNFYLSAPCFGDYQHRLLNLSHDIELYPVKVIDEESVTPQIAETEDEFMEILRAIFATPKTKRVIEAILAQSVGWED